MHDLLILGHREIRVGLCGVNPAAPVCPRYAPTGHQLPRPSGTHFAQRLTNTPVEHSAAVFPHPTAADAADIDDPGYMNIKIRKFKTDEFVT